MNNKSKRLLTLLLSAALTASTVNCFGVVAEDKSGTGTGETSATENVDTIENASVICEGVGSDNENITFVVFSDGQMEIRGSGKFSGFSVENNYDWYDEVKKIIIVSPQVDLSESLFNFFDNIESFDGTAAIATTAINNNFFAGNTSIKEVKLPPTIKSFDNCIFMGCTSLKEIDLPKSLERIGSESWGEVFSKSGITHLTLPENMKCIEHKAFNNCDDLTTIELNEGLETIEYFAFAYTDLRSLVLPESVKEIGNFAFSGCRNMESLKIQSDFKRIDNSSGNSSTIFDTSAPLSVEFSDKVTSIENYVFDGCHEMKEVKFSPNIKTIGKSAFASCYGLKELDLPKSLTTIEEQAFYSCDGLEEVTIPESVKTIGKRAFAASHLKRITILNPECEFYYDYDNKIGFINKETTIYGYKDSTAKEYAEKYGYNFKEIENTVETTTIASATTTKPAATTTTAPKTTAKPAATTTAAPKTTTKPAVTTTAAPKTTAKPAVTTTAAPKTTTKPAATTTAAPKTTTKPAATTTAAPKTTAKPAATTTAAPKTTAKPAATTAATTTTAAVKETTKKNEATVFGDSNNDGVIDLSDAVLIMQYISNPSKYGLEGTEKTHMTEIGLLNADVCNQGDGVTPKDALSIQKYTLQLIKSLPEN